MYPRISHKMARSSIARPLRLPLGRLGRNYLLITVIGICIVFFLYNPWTDSYSPLHSGTDPSGSDAVRLQVLMNGHSDPDKTYQAPKSSFNWSSVRPVNPPPRNLPLPVGSVNLPRVQADHGREDPVRAAVREARRLEVRALFQKNWASYRDKAWMRDALLPLSGAGRDQFSGWAATLVDSLDTLWIMGLRAEFDEAVEAVAGIDFGTSTSMRINMFETNIRYLGGLLAAYDLSGRKVLLSKAIELGDMLYAGFNTPKRMPVDFFDMALAKLGANLDVESRVVSASPGTLMMEFTRLSQITGDAKYYTAISKVMDVFERGQMMTAVPGMWPTMISMAVPDVISGTGFTLGSGADSLYEYVTKMYPLLGGRERRYRTMSVAWMKAADENLFFRPMLPGDESVLFSGNLDIVDVHAKTGARTLRLDSETEHLACFLGGTYALGGRLFKMPALVETGAALAKGCAYAYRAMPTGVGPERFNLVQCESREACAWNETRWEEEAAKKKFGNREHPDLPKGFTTVKDARYILRPEAIESVWYLWRITGQTEFQDIAWDMFAAVGNGTETQYANAAVKDVTKMPAEGLRALEKEDYMESFWLAETLKYFYLCFTPPDIISLDDYVLNTEAHPFRRPKWA